MIEIKLNELTTEEIQEAPSSFQELVRLTTLDEAILLCEAFGGREERIPVPDSFQPPMTKTGALRKARPKVSIRRELMDILCPASYESFLAAWGGADSFFFPRLDAMKRKRRNKLIRQAVDEAYRNKQSCTSIMPALVREHGTTRRHIYRILKMPD